MSDYRQNLINDIQEALSYSIDKETSDIVINKILYVLSDYDVQKKCTEIVTYNDVNQRLIKRYCACLFVDGKSDKTVYQYRGQLERFSEFIEMPLTKTDVYNIRLYLASKKDSGLTDVSVENIRSVLSAFFSWMYLEEIIDKNPCTRVNPIKCRVKLQRPFSEVEMDRLRTYCKNPKERAIIELLVTSGLRVSELAALDVSDLDFAEKAVRVRNGKGGKDRITYMNDVACIHIKSYLEYSKNNGSSALFYNKNHERIRSGGIRHILKELGKRAGVDNVHPHRFRHTFASNLVARGMDIQQVQRLLGHSNINTTMGYVYTSDDMIKASYERHIA